MYYATEYGTKTKHLIAIAVISHFNKITRHWTEDVAVTGKTRNFSGKPKGKLSLGKVKKWGALRMQVLRLVTELNLPCDQC